MAYLHIAATNGPTIDDFRAVSAKHDPPQTSTACSPGRPERMTAGCTW